MLLCPILAISCSGQPEPVGTLQANIDSPSPDEAEIERRQQAIRDYFQRRVDALGAVATTVTPLGQVIDWVPRAQDLATPPDAASVVAPPERDGLTLADTDTPPPEQPMVAMTELQADPTLLGPEGTVPVVRFNVEAYLGATAIPPADPADVTGRLPPPAPTEFYYAHWGRSDRLFYGASGYFNVWDPGGPSDSSDHSLTEVAHYAFLDVVDGGYGQSVETGPFQSYAQYGDYHTHLFTWFTRVGWSSGCGDYYCGYDQLQAGWQQVSHTVMPGAILSASTYGGTQTEIDIHVVIDSSLNWWIQLGSEWIGYYPRCRYGDTTPNCVIGGYLYGSPGLRYSATNLDWYGEVANTVHGTDIAAMGSGHFASEGWTKAAYLRNLRYNWSTSASYWYQSGEGSVSQSDTNCFTFAGPYFSSDPSWINWAYYGGPGSGASGCP
jgi:hypothetical protein